MEGEVAMAGKGWDDRGRKVKGWAREARQARRRLLASWASKEEG